MVSRVRSRRLRSPSGLLLYLALCSVGAPALALGCANQAQARGEQLWREGKGKPIVNGDYDPAKSLAPVIQAVHPAVVSITVSGPSQEHKRGGVDRRVLPFFPDGLPTPTPPHGTGSGFIISSDGLAVTNHHVVAGRGDLDVKLSDGRHFKAKVVGSDEETDLALLQIEGAKGLPTAVLGSSEKLQVGDRVFAIGSPLGLEQSVTTGIISGNGRGSLGLYRESYLDFLQTDAAISPGNSGGPLFNLNGEVVGINTAVSGFGNGLGFTIPIDQAKWVIPQLKNDGKVVRGWLGISGRDVEPAASGQRQPGAVVGDVHADTPAAKAGLERGDRIVKLDGESIDNFADLRGRIAMSSPDKAVKLEVERDGKRKKLDVKLEQRPHPDDLARMRNGFEPTPRRRGLYGDGPPRLGVDIEETGEGLVVRRVQRGSVAADLGLRKGDVLREINGRKIKKPADVRRALEKNTRRIEVEVERNGGTHTATIERM